MDKALATRQEVDLTPAEVVEGATTQAKILMSIVEQTKCYQEISGKKYLQVEAWETIGAFNRTHAETESVKAVVKDKETIGYEAHVQLFKDGNIVGGAIMPCYFTENCCKGKEGDAQHKAAMSAAQTFATSKAYRMNFSYVAILAGFQPTPAEEMGGTEQKSEHWCTIHDTAFFKRGKMKWYAHKIDGTDSWCSEEQVKKQKAQAVAEPTPVPRGDEGVKGPPDVKEERGQETEPEPPTEPTTPEELYELIAIAKAWKSSEPAHSFLVNKCKVSEDRIKNDPAGVYKEVIQML